MTFWTAILHFFPDCAKKALFIGLGISFFALAISYFLNDDTHIFAHIISSTLALFYLTRRIIIFKFKFFNDLVVPDKSLCFYYLFILIMTISFSVLSGLDSIMIGFNEFLVNSITDLINHKMGLGTDLNYILGFMINYGITFAIIAAFLESTYEFFYSMKAEIEASS